MEVGDTPIIVRQPDGQCVALKSGVPVVGDKVVVVRTPDGQCVAIKPGVSGIGDPVVVFRTPDGQTVGISPGTTMDLGWTRTYFLGDPVVCTQTYSATGNHASISLNTDMPPTSQIVYNIAVGVFDPGFDWIQFDTKFIFSAIYTTQLTYIFEVGAGPIGGLLPVYLLNMTTGNPAGGWFNDKIDWESINPGDPIELNDNLTYRIERDDPYWLCYIDGEYFATGVGNTTDYCRVRSRAEISSRAGTVLESRINIFNISYG
jgi:hypothetical protein